MGAAARRARRDGVTREPRGAPRAGPAGPGPAERGGGHAQPTDREGLPAGDLHDGLGGRGVRADRGRQRRPRTAGRRPGHVHPRAEQPGGQGPLRGRGPDAACALRQAVRGEEAATLAEHAGHAAGGRRAGREALPVTFSGFLPDRTDLAALLASADVALAPGPVETFGLAALEALACGTPVVVSAESALPEVAGDAGVSVTGEDLAPGVRELLGRPGATRRAAARARAERYDWPTAVQAFLAVHESIVTGRVKVNIGNSGMSDGAAGLEDGFTVGRTS